MAYFSNCVQNVMNEKIMNPSITCLFEFHTLFFIRMRTNAIRHTFKDMEKPQSNIVVIEKNKE